MARRHRRRSRALRYPRRRLVILAWFAGFLIALAVLLGVAYRVGLRGPTGLGAPFDAVLNALAKPGPALTVSFAALTAMAWCFRHLWLDLLAWLPGPIEIGTFRAATELPDERVDQLRTIFRQRLADVSLQAPSAVPGVAPEGDFLEVLGRGGVDSSNVLGSLLSLLRAAKPAHGWQVHVVLTERAWAPRLGVAVQVMRPRSQANQPVSVWDTTWDRAVRRAADQATAAILPHTKLCRPPWAHWRGYVMPGALFEAYEQAAQFERDRRYDEALSLYYEALREDPMNMALRLQIGQLQERLALHLDAFATYQGMLVVKEPGGSKPSRRRYRSRTRAQRRRALLAADYRRIVVLGGSELAAQWLTTGGDEQHWTRRDTQRRELRFRLQNDLKLRFEEIRRKHPREGGPAPQETSGAVGTLPLKKRPCLGEMPPADLLEDPIRKPGRGTTPAEARADPRYLELRELFALTALEDAGKLNLRAHLPRRGRRPLKPAILQLTALCIEQRLDWVQHKLPGESPTPLWPPSSDSLEKRIKKIENQFSFDNWHEHYNAACAYALPLLDDACPRAHELATEAVKRLARAAAAADSAFIATRRDWILSEDPDLDRLRNHGEFKAFEAMYFPVGVFTPSRPADVQRLEHSMHIRRMLSGTAQRWEDIWHRRGRTLKRNPDIHQLLEWWRDERNAWELIRDLAVHYRHWHTRLDLIVALRNWSEKYEFSAPDVPFPRYEDSPLEPEPQDGTVRPTAAKEEVEAMDRRLAALASALSDAEDNKANPALLDDLGRWESTLRTFDVRALQPKYLLLARLCDHHAGLWQRLGEWIEADLSKEITTDGEDEPAAQAFKAEVAEAAPLWRTA